MAHRRQMKDMKKLIVHQIDHLTKHECDCDCDIDIESGGTCLSCDKEFNSLESWLVHMKEEHWRI